MEPPAKRQRVDFGPTTLSSPPHNISSHGKGQRIADIEMVDDEEMGENYEADEDLQTQRARLDYKLKSTFEAIFEKYGKDFDGVGDEIDLSTGEILVNNGHLMQMQNERDVGEAELRTSSLDHSSTSSDDEGMEDVDSELDGDDTDAQSSDEKEERDDEEEEEEEEEDEDEEEEEDDSLSDGDMVEDDLILRGFSEASRYIHKKVQSEQVLSTNVHMERLEAQRQLPASRTTAPSNVLPSCADILSQFGPQLGPEIVKYVKNKGALDDSSIEPAWRAPPIASGRTEKHPKPRPAIRRLENERSPSPQYSVWATNNAREKPARLRTNFTEEEDASLLEFVAEVRRLGLDMWAHQTWKILAVKHPQHNYIVWKNRYRHKYMYLHAVEEGALSNSEASASVAPVQAKPIPFHHGGKEKKLSSSGVPSCVVTEVRPSLPPRRSHTDKQAPPLHTTQRPTRVRKSVQRDPTMLDWSEAVATIKSVDPALHSSLVQDSQHANSEAPFRYTLSTTARSKADDKNFTIELHSNQRVHPTSTITTPPKAIKSNPTWLESDDPDELAEDNSLTPHHQLASPISKSCTYRDCASSKPYRLRRRPNEELSPMCLHLLQAHQVTPFPCREPSCDRTGPHGFCLQVELVRHVRIAHPSPEALNRLRSRVSSLYLEEDYSITNSNWPINMTLPTIPAVEMVSIRGFLPDSREPYRHIDTSKGFECQETNRITKHHEPTSITREYRSLSSDVTSLSRLRIKSPRKNVSSGCFVLNEYSPSTSSRTVLDQPQPEFEPKQSVPEFGLLADNTPESHQLPRVVDKSTKLNIPALPQNKVDPSYEFSDDEDVQPIGDHAQPTKDTLSQEHPSQAIKKISFRGTNDDSRGTNDDSRASKTLGIAKKIKDEVTELEALDHQVIVGTDLQPVQEHANEPGTVKLPGNQIVCKIKEKSSRASERPGEMFHTDIHISTPGDQNASQETLPKQYAAVKPESTDGTTYAEEPAFSDLKPSFTTPTKSKGKPRKSILKNIASSDELDELSPCADDFVLLYSKPRSRTRHGSGSQGRVKREDMADAPTSVLPTRKRKFVSLVDDDEADELGGDEPVFLLSSTRQPNRPFPSKTMTDASCKNSIGVGNTIRPNGPRTPDKSHSSSTSVKLEKSTVRDFPSSPTRRLRPCKLIGESRG